MTALIDTSDICNFLIPRGDIYTIVWKAWLSVGPPPVVQPLTGLSMVFTAEWDAGKLIKTSANGGIVIADVLGTGTMTLSQNETVSFPANNRIYYETRIFGVGIATRIKRGTITGIGGLRNS